MSAAPSERTQALLRAPLLSTLLRLAAPNVLGLLATTVTIAYDGWIVGRLGPDALAGVALVFPLAMLMVQMSGGGIGGTTTAAVARALGAGDRDGAGLLALQALWLALAFALLFTLVLAVGGPLVFAALGGRGAVLQSAQAYGGVMFGGAAIVWVSNGLAGAVRGSGQMALASGALLGMAVGHLALCPLLVFGIGGWSGWGVAGAAASTLLTQAVGAAVLLAALHGGRGPLRLALCQARPRPAVLRQLLRLALPAMLSPLLSNASIAIATAWVATVGTAALAGYGLAARLEAIVVPIAFGFGSALTALVATNLGAGQAARALHAAWTGAAVVLAVTGCIGLVAALHPQLWMRLFASDPAVIAAGAGYLRVVGGCYGLFGMGLALFFAAQGAGRLFWPLVGSVSRLLVVALGGWLALRIAPGRPEALFIVVAGGFVVYAAVIASALAVGRWGVPRRS